VSKAVVVLTPDGRGKKDVERCNRFSPRYFIALLEPLAVLIDHTVDDVNERLVAVEHTVTSSEEIALEPSYVLISDQMSDDLEE